MATTNLHASWSIARLISVVATGLTWAVLGSDRIWSADFSSPGKGSENESDASSRLGPPVIGALGDESNVSLARPGAFRDRLIGALGKPQGGIFAEAFLVPCRAQRGKPITLIMSIKNLNSRTVGVCTEPGSVWIYDELGKPVSLSAEGMKMWPRLILTQHLPGAVEIRPGCAIAERFPLDRFFDLSRAGNYTVMAGHWCRLVPPIWVGAKVANLEISAVRNGSNDTPVSGTPATHLPTLLFDLDDGFEKQWRDAMGLAGRSHDDLALDASLSPVDSRSAEFVISLKNVSSHARFSDKYSISSDASYSPEDGVSLSVGTRAADYRILLRDDLGNAVQLTEFGRKWLGGRAVPLKRPLRPGEAAGFVFPLNWMFAVKGGKDYTAIAILLGEPKKQPGWVASPVKVHVPDPEIPGVNRPLYGSLKVRDRMLVLAAAHGAELKLKPAVSFDRDSVAVEMVLQSQTNHAISFSGWQGGHDRGCKASQVFLLFDCDGVPVQPNADALYFQSDWSFVSETVIYPHDFVGGDGYPRGSKASAGFLLGLAYPLRPGDSYTVLSGANVTGDLNALIVAAPETFTTPFSDSARGVVIPTSGKNATTGNPSHDKRATASADGDWQQLARFAGRPWDGLFLDATVARETTDRRRAVQVVTSLKNRGGRLVLFKKWKGQSGYEILVRDPAGRLVSTTEKGKKFFGFGTVLDDVALEPGEAMADHLPVGELFEMQSPGEYTVLVSLPVIGDVDAVLTAAPIKVRIDSRRGISEK